MFEEEEGERERETRINERLINEATKNKKERKAQIV